MLHFSFSFSSRGGQRTHPSLVQTSVLRGGIDAGEVFVRKHVIPPRQAAMDICAFLAPRVKRVCEVSKRSVEALAEVTTAVREKSPYSLYVGFSSSTMYILNPARDVLRGKMRRTVFLFRELRFVISLFFKLASWSFIKDVSQYKHLEGWNKWLALTSPTLQIPRSCSCRLR